MTPDEILARAGFTLGCACSATMKTLKLPCNYCAAVTAIQMAKHEARVIAMEDAAHIAFTYHGKGQNVQIAISQACRRDADRHKRLLGGLQP